MIVLGVIPTLPAEISVGSTSLKWQEKLAEKAHEEKLLDMKGQGAVVGPPVGSRPPTLEDANRQAREARNVDELWTAIRLAEEAALIEAQRLRDQSQ